MHWLCPGFLNVCGHSRGPSLDSGAGFIIWSPVKPWGATVTPRFLLHTPSRRRPDNARGSLKRLAVKLYASPRVSSLFITVELPVFTLPPGSSFRGRITAHRRGHLETALGSLTPWEDAEAHRDQAMTTPSSVQLSSTCCSCSILYFGWVFCVCVCVCVGVRHRQQRQW